MNRRTDQEDDSRSRFRSDRFFLSDGRWYFSTREDENLGPFATRGDAELAVIRYVTELTGVEPGTIDPWSVPGARN